MEYLIHQEKMDELNAIIGQQGGPATSAVSDALAAGDTAKAVEANKIDGQAWANLQKWHDDRINEDQYGDPGGQPGGNQPLPGIPPNAIQMYPDKDGHLKTADGKEVTIKGKNYAAYVQRGQGATGPVYWFKGDFDAGMASMSCDGHKIAFTVTDSPSDPGEPYNGNTAYVNGYKAGQACNLRIGEGGYSDEVLIIFSIN